jgi:predicted PurR-regulated permease PerM
MKTKRQFKSKRGFSAIIASLILMLLAVAAGVVVYGYVMGWIGGATTNPRQSGHLSFDITYANATASKIQFVIRNVGGTTLVLDQVYVNGNNATGNCTPTISSLTSLAPQAVVALNVTYTMTSSYYYNIQVTCKDGTLISQSVQAQ